MGQQQSINKNKTTKKINKKIKNFKKKNIIITNIHNYIRYFHQTINKYFFVILITIFNNTITITIILIHTKIILKYVY